jgi:translation initiation factor 2 subunit 1
MPKKTNYEKEEDMPEEGEFLVVTCSKVTPYGAYFKIDEYHHVTEEAFCHISEIAATWVRNIRNYIKEGQKTVAKVLRVNRQKRQVDVSMRRVSDSQKRETLRAWKNTQKATNLLALAQKRIKELGVETLSLEEVNDIMEKEFGSSYGGLEAAFEGGAEVLINAGIPEEWAEILEEFAKASIEVKKVKISGIFSINSTEPNGIDIIKDALIKALTADKKSEIDIYSLGAPRYRIEVEAKEFQTAEKALSKAINKVQKAFNQTNCTFQFERE